MLVTQSFLTVCNPMDYSPPGSSVQAFSRQEYWSREPFPSPGDLADPGTEFESPALQADWLPSKPRSMWDLNSPTRDQNLSPVL